MSFFFTKIDVSSLEQAALKELHRLCSQQSDEVISEEDLQHLNTLLNESSAARRVYLHYVGLQSMLSAVSGRRDAIEFAIQDIRAMCDPHANQPISSAPLSPASGKPFHWTSLAWAVAAVLLLGLGVAYWNVPQQQEDSVASAELDRNEAKDTMSSAGDPDAAVASLSYVSPEVRWKEGAQVASGSEVSQGKLFAIERGEIELTYASGTRLMLIGPADYLLKKTGGELRRGGLIASVTEDGHGFTIQTPNGKVVDLGTEFGVVVDDFGVSEVSVFQGKVEAYPQNRASAEDKVELTRGHGLQWSKNDLIALDADLRRFTSSVMQVRDGAEGSEPASVFSQSFEQAQFDESNWKILGDSILSSGGLVLTSGDSNRTPYLISTNQYDPSQGPVIVTCDIRFDDSDVENGTAAFSILTRSVDQRGTAPPPWDDILASCIRCTFSADGESAGGLIEAGVKLEEDREPTATSWNSFLQPEAGKVYRLEMRDDGVNVTFTASLRDDPTTAKTVSCRSLFRGLANHVAFESCYSDTKTQIEKIEIKQERSLMDLSDYASFSSFVQEIGNQNLTEERLLSRLVPKGSKLLVQDNFDSEDIDQEKWNWLGDVSSTGSAIQLGLPNPDSHIDTWKPRPYLLTQVPVDLSKGEIAILGKVTFSDNFLVGYGASFAVMTRANDQRGQGPGWEHSVLKKGVRLNFWPASWDTDHSLEVHEKATSNSLELLAIQGFTVDPRVRTYLFRAKDNGEQVEFAIVDPARPNEINSITTSTQSKLKEGFIGFESCWGSPVILDDVAIYYTTYE